MSQNKILDIPPVALGNAVANVLNCNITSLSGPVGYTQTQPFLIVWRVRAVNNDSVSHTVKLFKGATGASAVGTEWGFTGNTIPANSFLEIFCKARFESTDFLTGVADVANKVTLNIDAEIGIQ